MSALLIREGERVLVATGEWKGHRGVALDNARSLDSRVLVQLDHAGLVAFAARQLDREALEVPT